jgi:TM2 domain-containing membrane protein YozV
MSTQDQSRIQWIESLKKKNEREAGNWTATFWLSLLLGVLGADRFYLGSSWLGLLKALSFGGLGAWWLIDIILLLTVGMKNSEGQRVRMPAHK